MSCTCNAYLCDVQDERQHLYLAHHVSSRRAAQRLPCCLTRRRPGTAASALSMHLQSKHILLMPFVVMVGAPQKLPVNPGNLKKAWESSQRVTKEDWAEWMRHFSVELLRESPSPALRACHELAQARMHHDVAQKPDRLFISQSLC